MKKFLTSKIGNILLCIAEIIVGVLLLVNPDAVTSAFIIGAGAVMILTGIVFCTLYFVGEAEKMVIKQLLFKGLLLIILGVLCVTQYGVLLAALPFVTWVYAIAMLILAAYKVQCTVDILRLSGIRWHGNAPRATRFNRRGIGDPIEGHFYLPTNRNIDGGSVNHQP